jgi:outer membrane receptor protein involved in Fe transport
MAGRILVYIIIFFLYLCNANAQNTGSLSGTVKDSKTKEIVIGATIKVVGTYIASASDADGKYIINGIKPGDYTIKITSIGFSEAIYTGIKIEANKTKILNVMLTDVSQSIGTVTVYGQKNLIDLESGESGATIKREDIAQMNMRDVKEIASSQAGVVKGPDGIQIRGARVYETQYVVDGIGAADPLAGTGFGTDLNAGSIGELNLITGGIGAEYGDGSAGVVSATIREGEDRFQISGNWQRDHLAKTRPKNGWNTDIGDLSFGGPVPFTKGRLSYFNNVTFSLTDDYFGPTANQLHSSLFTKNDSFWAPRNTNNFTHTFKLSYKLKKGTKITLSNQHSLSINQSTRTLQIVGFDAVMVPGYQFNRSLNLDNANTYTHQSNLTAFNLKHSINKHWLYTLSIGRLFTNLRADANGRPFRTRSVDQLFDENSIVTDPVYIFNPGDSVQFVLPGPGLVNNGGIAPLWHDHYAKEWTLSHKFRYYPTNNKHQFLFGWEHKQNEYQWVDVTRPWVGAPIYIDDSTATPSISVGSSSDIWKVRPNNGGFFAQDKITYKGIIANIGLRVNYWAPGKFADNAVNNENSPVLDQIRTDYKKNTFGLFGLRYKARILPKINVTFPVTTNNTLYFNYGHSMKLPHPRFLYAGLDPDFQNQSFLANLGNPDLNPEVNVSYEVGVKSMVTKDFGVTVSAFNNNRFDYIVSRRVIVKDVTGRPVSKTMYINQDYAKIMGVELGTQLRVTKFFRTYLNITYQVARGKSNSARESQLQIEQTGEVPISTEQYLSFDRPWNINNGIVFTTDSTFRIFPKILKDMVLFISNSYQSGFRYTPQKQEGTNSLGRPQYAPQNDKFLESIASPWYNTDIKISKMIKTGKQQGLVLSVEIRNAWNNKNAQIINPVTGRAYEPGDDVPTGWRDPRYVGPEEDGVPPDNPARYLPPRQVLMGLSFRF